MTTLTWHGNFSAYAQAKLRILKQTDIALLNADDPAVVQETVFVVRTEKSSIPWVHLLQGSWGVVEDLLVDRAFVKDPLEAEVIAELKDIYPKVAHGVSNALAAAGLARSIGVSNDVISKAIQSFARVATELRSF
ncbi:MAG: hypothetical protein WDO06_10055 [Actinomycetota bacterium]